MCFGGGGSKAVQRNPTVFDYSAADRSNTAQRQAAVLSATNGGSADNGSFGSQLGTGGTGTTAAATTTGAK